MRPHYPGCECALIILLSSSNKAAGEINGYGSCAAREPKGGGAGMCVGDLRRHESRARDQSLSVRKEEEGEGGKKEERRKEERITW